VATFNILHGQRVLGAAQGASPETPADPGDLAVAVRALECDVLGMQEVDSHQPRSGGVDQSLVAAEAMGLGADAQRRRFVPSVVGTPGHRDSFDHAEEEHQMRSDGGPTGEDGPLYGVALMVRPPVIAWHRTTFPPAKVSLPLLVPARPRPKVISVPDEPRAAVAAVIETERGPMTVATVHLSFVPGYNAWQLRRLHRWLQPLPRPLVLLGDFNLPGSLPGVVTKWASVVDHATYPSFGPRVRFDHILLDGFSDSEVADVRSSVQVHRMMISDHCAVTAEIPIV